MFYIQKRDWDKIINYARAREAECGDEIGGMAIAKMDKDGDWQIGNPVILKQTTSAGTCTLDKDELSNFYIEMADKYGTDIQFVWWHSHAKMQAFWSGTDTNTMTEYKSGDWSMFLVVNVREEYKFRVQYWNPMEIGEDVELEIVNEDKEYKIPKSIIKEVEEKCSKETNGWGKSGYSYNTFVRNGSQATLWNMPTTKKEEIDELLDEVEAWNDAAEQGYGNYLSYEDIQSNPVGFLADKLDEGNTAFIDGRISYSMYKKAVDDFNDTLRKLEGKKSPKLRVVLWPEKDLMDKVLMGTPLDFLTLDNEPILELFYKREQASVVDIDNIGGPLRA